MHDHAERTCFDCCIHPRPLQVRRGPDVRLGRTVTPTLDPACLLGVGTFDRCFEDVARDLAAMEGVSLEPDGAFFWVGDRRQGQPLWHLEGHFLDSGPALALAQLEGFCANEQLDFVLTALGWPGTAVLFQLRELGILVEEDSFRRLCLTSCTT